ncbi:MAG: hypothetical protein ABF542_12400 [Gluconobacter sp.]
MKRFLLAASLLIPLSAHAQVSPSKWTQNYIPTLADWRAALLYNGQSVSSALETEISRATSEEYLKLNKNGDTSVNQILKSPTLAGGTLDGAQSITTTSGITQSLASLLGQQINVVNYGAVAGGTDSGTAVKNALSTAANRFPVYFPYSAYGYTINSGTYTGKEIGTWLLNGNRITGNAIGVPSAGTGTLISPYTNPYLIATDRKSVYDPAAIPQPSTGATAAESVECLPNRVNSQNTNVNRNWIACRYVGADTGSGGTTSIDISTDV